MFKRTIGFIVGICMFAGTVNMINAQATETSYDMTYTCGNEILGNAIITLEYNNNELNVYVDITNDIMTTEACDYYFGNIVFDYNKTYTIQYSNYETYIDNNEIWVDNLDSYLIEAGPLFSICFDNWSNNDTLSIGEYTYMITDNNTIVRIDNSNIINNITEETSEMYTENHTEITEAPTIEDYIKIQKL